MRLTIPQHQLTLSGNTAGALTNLSSGTVTLAGGNNITLSQVGNAVTISGANAAGAQTGISGLANSQTTYTSGTVSLSELGALTIRSSTGQIFQLEAPATSSLSATGAVSISVNGSTISIGAPVQSTQVETQTFIGGVSASDTLYTSGTVRITGVGGGVTVSSNTGQRVDISVAAPVAQSVQTQNVVDLTLSGNTAGALALISSGTATLAGGNNITLSQAGNAITISGPNVAGAQTGISGLVGSDATYTSGTVTISGVGGGVTVNSNTGQRIDISVAAQSVQPETQTFIAGVSASDTLYTSGNVRITGVGGGVTVSSNTGQRIDISVAAQSVQPETQTFIAGVSASDTLYTSGNVRITGVGGGITVSSNTGQRVDLSVAAPVAQTDQAGSVYAISNTSGTSSGTYDARTLSIAGAGLVTVAASNSGWRINVTTAAQTNQAGGVYASSNTFGTSSGTYDARSISIAGSGAVGVAASNSGWIISAPAQSVQPETQTFIGGISASDTLYTSGSVRITGVGGGVTVSSNTGQRVDISVAAPVAQTNQAGSVYAISNTSGTSSGTYDARTLSIAGAGIVTVAASNSGWRINASQSVQTQQNIQALYDGANSISTGTVRVTDANGVTFSINAQTLSASVNQSISMFAVSNTTQSTSGTAHKSALSFAGAGAASVGVTGGSVVVSVAAGGGAFSGGVSTGGNTAGATGITGTQLVFVGSNNISLSQTTGANGGTITINNTVSAFQAGVSTGGNTAGDTGVTGTRLVLVGVTPMSLSQVTGANGGTVSINAPATSSLVATGAVEISTNGSTISIGAPAIKTIGDYQNFPLAQGALMTHVASISKTPFYWNEELPGKLTANSFVFRLSCVTTATLQSFSAHAGIYTLVNSTSAALLGSWSESYVLSTASSASWSGIRNFVMTALGTHTNLSVLTGGDYMFGMMFSAGATGSMHQSLYGAGAAGGPLGRIVPGANAASTGTSQGVMALFGRGSTTVNALPANVVASELVNQGQGASMQLHPWIYIRS